jgi:hypothetical protein
MPPIKGVFVTLLIVFVFVTRAEATTYASLALHERVKLSDTIVLARVVDPARAVVSVERVLKGAPAKQITLVAYVDGFNAPAQRKHLVQDARELIFLTRKGDAYAPLQTQYGRLAVDGDRLIDSFGASPRSLLPTLASIERLVAFQARVAQGGVEATNGYITALQHADVDVQKWALSSAAREINNPSRELVDAVLARWPKDARLLKGWPHDAGMIANAVVRWRLPGVAPFFAKILATSGDGEERAFAAMALGGTGDRTYLPELRHVAAQDTHPNARALAYGGIMRVAGPDSLVDLRLGAKDPNERVRAQVVVDSYNMLELAHPEPRWPPPSAALIGEVRALLTAMLRDPSPHVSNNARAMLSNLARHLP